MTSRRRTWSPVTRAINSYFTESGELSAALAADQLITRHKPTDDIRATPLDAAVALLSRRASDQFGLEWTADVLRGYAAGAKGGKVLVEVTRRAGRYSVVMLAKPPWSARLHLAALHGIALLEQPAPPLPKGQGRVPLGERLKGRKRSAL